tara:strand:+ start:118 stop:1194 length:1077 start_codon:yes stop_codon:yes gene_type:complete
MLHSKSLNSESLNAESLNPESLNKFNLKDSLKKIVNEFIEILFHGKKINMIDQKKQLVIIVLFLIILIILNQFYRYFIYKFILKRYKYFDINSGKYNESAELKPDKKYLNSSKIHFEKHLLPIMKKSLFSKSEYDYEGEILNIKNGDIILDLSLSNGDLSLYLLKKYSDIKVTILVCNEEYYDKVTTKLEKFKNRIDIIFCKEESIEVSDVFKNDMYDKIMVLNTIGKIENKRDFFKKCKDSLKKEGKLYIKTVCFADKNSKRFGDITNFWQYNFSTRYNLCYDLYNSNFKNISYSEIDHIMLLLSYLPKDIILLMIAFLSNIKYLINSKVPTIKVLLTHLYVIFNGLKTTMIICDNT